MRSFDNPFIEFPLNLLYSLLSYPSLEIHVKEAHCNNGYFFVTPIDTSLLISSLEQLCVSVI